jgi:8-oxo-dGTP pyrophosphatase MutT (NUDIX family)
VTLEEMVRRSPTNWTEPEWGFPKGRANANESEIETAIREFIEETGIKRENFRILKNLQYIDEVFRSENNQI